MADATGISVTTVEHADALATTVLSLMDVVATGQRSVNDILADAIAQADEYRRSRMNDAHQKVGG